MSIDNTAQKILDLPEKGSFVFRGYKWEPDWTGEIGSYADLKALARLWLRVGEVLPQLSMCWSLDPSDEHFDNEAYQQVRKLFEAMEKE